MSETFSKVEVITGVARRRRFPTEQKVAVIVGLMSPGFLGHLFPRRSACRLSNLRRSGQKATLLPELRRFDHTE